MNVGRSLAAAHLLVALACLCLVVPGCVPSAPPLEGTVELSAEVSLLKSSGCRIKGGEAVLLDEIVTQADPDRIVIEAEDALAFQWQEGVGALKKGRVLDTTSVVQIYAGEKHEYGPREAPAEEVGGGKYIDRTHKAVYVFKVTKAGRYTRWTRHFLPRAAGWTYREQMDDTPANLIILSNASTGFPAGEWFWSKTGTWELQPGTHTFIVTNLHGGKRIDRFVLLREGAKPPTGQEIGPAASPLTKVEEGYVVSEPFRPVGTMDLGRMRIESDDNGGGVDASVSVDGGKTWQRVPADGDLSKVRLPVDESGCLFRFDLKRGQASPVFKGAAVSFRTPAKYFAVLENEYVRLRFDRRTGRPCGIVNKATGQVIQPEGLWTDPLEVQLRPGSTGEGPYPKDPLPEPTVLTADDAVVERVTVGARRIETVLSFPVNGLKTTTRTELKANDPESLWTVTIDNGSTLNFQSVRYPRIERVIVGETSVDDVLAWGRIGGEMIVVPAQAGAWALTYPGRASVGFMDVFDDTGGVYLAHYDPAATASDLEMNPRADAHHIDLVMRKRHRLAPGQSASWTVGLAPHAGDWHWGADRYREYFHRVFGKPDYPQWLIDCDGWMAASYMNRPLDGPHYHEYMRRGFEDAMRFGYDYVQTWATTGHGACPSFYTPLKELGGSESFARANAWWDARGGKVGYYFHGNALGERYVLADAYFTTPWSEYPEELRAPDWRFFVENKAYNAPDAAPNREAAKKAADENHRQIIENNNRKGRYDTFPRMSMRSPAWRDYQARWADYYVTALNAHVIYWDTFAWGGDANEYNPYLGCYGEGDLTPHKIKFLRDVVARARKTTPEFHQLTEGCVDVLGLDCFHMISGFTRHPEVFRYTLPEQIVFEGHQNGGWGTPRGSRDRIESAFLYGNKFDLYAHLAADYQINDIIILRKWMSTWLNAARFRDNVGVRVTSADVQAKVHDVDIRDARGVIVTMRNPSGLEGATVTLDKAAAGSPRTAMVFRPGQAPQAIKPARGKDGSVSFAAPTDKVSAVMLVERARGGMGWIAGVHQRGTDGIVLQLVNLGEGDLPMKLTCDRQQADVTLPPASAVTRVFRRKDHFATERIEKIDVSVTAAGATRDLFMGLMPPVDDRSFERAGVLSAEARHGKKVLALKPGQLHRFRLTLTPGKTYRVTMQVKANAKGLGATLRTANLATRFWGGARYADGRKVVYAKFDIPKKPGEWVTATATITPAGPGDLELRAAGKPEDNLPPVLVDDVRVEEVD